MHIYNAYSAMYVHHCKNYLVEVTSQSGYSRFRVHY